MTRFRGPSHEVDRDFGYVSPRIPAMPERAPPTPAEAAATRVYRLRQDAEGAATKAAKLTAIAERAAWRTEKAALDQTRQELESKVAEREADATATDAAREDYEQAKTKLAELVSTLENAKEPRVVPPVAGEVDIEPRVIERTAVPDDVFAWAASLSGTERGALRRRLDKAFGTASREDGFAVALANYLARQRVLDPFRKVLADPRQFDRAAYERAQAAREVPDEASPGAPDPGDADAAEAGEGNEVAANENAATEPPAAAVVQRKQTSEPGLTDERVVATAAAGVEGASAPLPHLDAIQESFGRHDVTGVRAQIGGDGTAAAGAIGAEAYAVGDRAAFASSAPDLYTAAHEATHIVQQRAGVSLLGGVGEAGDRHEQEADAVADAVVAGRSAEPLLDEITDRTGGPVQSVQRKLGATLVPASQYLTGSNARDLAETIARHLGSVDWIQPDPRLPWRTQGSFKRALVERLVEPILGSSEPGQHLRTLCHPANPLTLIDEMRPVERAHSGKLLEAIEPAAGALVGPADWRPSIGLAIAQLLEASIIASLRRLGPRWVACADRGMSEEARLDETRSLVPYDALITSHPIDRIVGRAITGEAVFDFREDPERAAAASGEPVAGGIRPVTIEWQGDHDPNLWNWVKADPPDASAAEVAAALFAGADKKDGERRTFLAYLLTPAPPLFGVAPSTAIGFAGAKRHAPADGKDAGPDEHVMAVASGVATGEIALHQGADEALPAVGEEGPKATLRDLVSGNQLQLQYLVGALAPWNLAEAVGQALGFLLGKQGELMTSQDADLAAWARVLTAQRGNLQRIGAGVRQVVDKASELGLSDPTAPEAAPLRDVLTAYARAAGTSHLADTSRALIDEAAGKQAGLALLALQGSSRGLDVALDQLRAGTGTDDRLRTGYLREGAELQDQSVALQSRLLAGENVPAEELDEITLQADTLALRARVRTASTQLDALEQAAHAAGEGLAQELAAAMSSDFRGVEPTCAKMRATINLALTQMDQEMAPPTVYPGQQVGEDARRRQRVYDAGPKDPRQSLRAAEEKFQEIAGNEEFVQFLRHGASLVEWQGFRTACIQVAALVGVGIAGGVVGGLAGGAARGMMMRAGAAESIGELGLGARAVGFVANVVPDAAINAAGQHVVMGQSLGDAFAENLLTTAAATGVLGVLEANAAKVAQVEQVTAGLWQKVKGGTMLVLKEGAAITGHTIMGAALGYASHKIVTGEKQPPPETAREWFLQGAAMTVGRYVGQGIEARIQGFRKMRRANALGERLYQRAVELQKLAERVEAKPEASDALDLLNRRHELLVEELRMLESLLSDEAAMGRAKLERDDIHEMQVELEGQLANAHASGGADITFHLAGLEELVPGAVWRGTHEEIKNAVESAEQQAAGTDRKVKATRDETTGKWDVEIDGRRIEVHERADAKAPARGDEAKAKEPGRVVLAGEDADLRAAAEWLEPLPGTLDVVVHGTIDDLVVLHGGTEQHIDHRRLALYIKKSGAKYERIRLAACKSGTHAKGVAQHLANKLGVEVIAPTDTLHVSEDGTQVIGPKKTRNTGRWETFTPKKSELRWKAPAEGGTSQGPHNEDHGEVTNDRETVELGVGRPDATTGQSRDRFEAATDRHLANVEAQVGGEAGRVVRETEELALNSEWQFEAGLRIADPLFGRAASDALKRAATAQTDPKLAEQVDALGKRARGWQRRMLEILRDPSLDAKARRPALRSLIDEMEGAFSANRSLFPETVRFEDSFRFDEARRAVDSVIDAAFDNKLVLDDKGMVKRGQKELGSFRDLMDKVITTNRALAEAGEPHELVISVSETRPGIREVLVLSRPRSDRGPQDASQTLEVQDHPDPQAVIVDVGAGESSFALDLLAPADRAGGPVVQTEYGPGVFDGARTRRDLTWENAVPRTDADGVVVFGDPLQTMDVLFGEGGVKRVFINNVNAHYRNAQYASLARVLLRAMAPGGRVEVQWTNSPEYAGGDPGSRGHIDGRQLEDAIKAEIDGTGRSYAVDHQVAPITDYEYSIRPSTRRGGAASDKDQPSSPVPESRSIFTFN